MPINGDISSKLQAAVRSAAASRTSLKITGHGTKSFYGRATGGQVLDVSRNQGVVAHEPTELVITARGGTPLADIEATLAEHGQMLGFEPPYFGDGATLGGAIACGFSGPRRPYAGAARDFVLGVKILNGKGEILSFGGQVMKNVAGYDISRLMVGALGTLGILLEVSLKVIPRPAREVTLAFETAPAQALATMNRWASQPLPLSAACQLDDTLYVRLSGSENGVAAAQAKLGGEAIDRGASFWCELREHKQDFFAGDMPLWRLSIAPSWPMLDLPGKWLLDWGGAQRWLRSDADAADVRHAAEQAGGHATLFRGDRTGDVFHPLPPALKRLHRNLKRAFDPEGILNPSRFFRDW